MDEGCGWLRIYNLANYIFLYDSTIIFLCVLCFFYFTERVIIRILGAYLGVCVVGGGGGGAGEARAEGASVEF